MSRIALVSHESRLRDVLVALADAGAVELVGSVPSPEGEEVEALRRLERDQHGAVPEPRIAPEPLDVSKAERAKAADLLAGEVELKRRAASAVRHGGFAALVGWIPRDELAGLEERLVGGRRSRGGAAPASWAEPPTLLRPARPARPFRPLVETYGPARYADVDPTLFAALSFVVMFGMMFGDVGHGLVLVIMALMLRRARRGRLAGFRTLWPLPAAAGVAAAFFGLLYGEAFGPTGIVPTLWLDPVDEPVRLLAAAVGIGAFLLAVSYGLGVINRWREEGAAAALVAPSGIAGLAVFVGAGIAAAGWYWERTGLLVVGAVVAASGVILLAAGFLAGAGRGATAIAETIVEVFDAVVRIGANTISFARLAAFGLMHAAIGKVVFDAASAAWGGALGALLAVIVFLGGNALAFALEALVAGVQALRLEYYELFSRVFAGEGRTFSPWRVPLAPTEETS